MSPVEKYLRSTERGDFKWECIETIDGYVMYGVAVEGVTLKGREATITKESDNEFEVDVVLKNGIVYQGEFTYEVIEYRSSRLNARVFAERIIKQDIEKDEVK